MSLDVLLPVDSQTCEYILTHSSWQTECGVFVRQTLFGLSQPDEGDVHVQVSDYVSLQPSALCMPNISRQSCNCRTDASRARESSSQTFYLLFAAGTTHPFGAPVICPRTKAIMVWLVGCHLICRKGIFKEPRGPSGSASHGQVGIT